MSELLDWMKASIERTAREKPVPDTPGSWDVRNCRRGDRVLFLDAAGVVHAGRALGRWRQGRDSPVIPVCTEQEWRENEPPDELAWRAWPLESVVPDIARVSSGESTDSGEEER